MKPTGTEPSKKPGRSVLVTRDMQVDAGRSKNISKRSDDSSQDGNAKAQMCHMNVADDEMGCEQLTVMGEGNIYLMNEVALT